MEAIRKEKALNIPNLLTAARIALLPAVVWRYRSGDSLGALAFYLAAMLTDVLDGMIARRFNQITALGKLLDPIADKLTLLALLWLFVADGQISVWVLWLVLMKELLLVAGSVVAFQKGIVVYAMPIGKVTTLTFALSMTARFLALRRTADLLLALSVLLSVTALVWYVIARLEQIKPDCIAGSKMQ